MYCFELCFTPVLHSSSVSPLFFWHHLILEKYIIVDVFSKCLPFFCFSSFLLIFSFSFFVCSLWNLPFWSLSCSILQKKNVFQSLFFFHLLDLSSLFAFICFNISFSIWSLFQCLLFLLVFFFFENFSFLTFFAHMFLSSLSFFLFHRFSSFFCYLLFFVSSFTFIFRKKYVFVLCPCRDAETFSHHGKEKKKLMVSPRERCEEPDCVCSENWIVWTSNWAQTLINVFSSPLPSFILKIFVPYFLKFFFVSISSPFYCPLFNTKKLSLFFGQESEQIISFSLSKSLFVFSVVQISCLESQFLWFPKQNKFLHPFVTK